MPLARCVGVVLLIMVARIRIQLNRGTEGGALLIIGRTPFNVFYTGLPILLLGVYDRDISQYMALRYPRLYREGPARAHFNLAVVTKWLVLALYHSVAVVVVSVYISPEGGSEIYMGLAEFGFYGMYFTILVVNVKLAHAVEMWFWW